MTNDFNRIETINILIKQINGCQYFLNSSFKFKVIKELPLDSELSNYESIRLVEHLKMVLELYKELVQFQEYIMFIENILFVVVFMFVYFVSYSRKAIQASLYFVM